MHPIHPSALAKQIPAESNGNQKVQLKQSATESSIGMGFSPFLPVHPISPSALAKKDQIQSLSLK
jgi:hypothetical protein